MISVFLHKLKNEEEGSIIIYIAIIMVVFMIFLALTLDIGSAYLSTGNLQKAADAAVLSAGQLLPVDQQNLYAVNDIKDNAINYANQNGFSGLTRDNVELGNSVNGKYTYIKVNASKNVKMNFARTFGINQISISRSSKAMLSPKSKITGATPIGVLSDELSELIATHNTNHVTLKYGKSGGENGFFGALDLNGQGGGASDYRLWLAHGYPGEITVGDILLQENGNMVGPTYQGFSERYNGCTHFGAQYGGSGCTADHYDPTCPRVAKVVIYSINSSSTVVVTGFAAFVLEAQSSGGYITGSFVNTLTESGESTGEKAGTDEDYGFYSLMLSE